MAYSYRERLKTGGDRFAEVNDMLISYKRYNGATISGIRASPVLINPLNIDPNTAIIRTERQQFIIHLDQLKEGSIPFLPVLGDVLVDDEAEEFEIVRESDNSPIYQFITADRTVAGGRIKITTQRIQE